MISIITPTYNRSEHLRLVACALSKQTNQDFEWIIVDDGSTDDTENTVKDFLVIHSFKALKYYKFDKHTGYRQNRCRNQGARMADKESKAYLFLDADVLLYPDVIEKYIEALNKNDRRIIVGMYWWGKPIEITPTDVLNNWNKY